MEGQLRKLRNGVHPRTGACLPLAVELDPVIRPTRATEDDPDRTKPEGFYEYVPAISPPAVASDSMPGAERLK